MLEEFIINQWIVVLSNVDKTESVIILLVIIEEWNKQYFRTKKIKNWYVLRVMGGKKRKQNYLLKKKLIG